MMSRNNKEPKKVSLQQIIGCGYADYWNFKGRYRVVKGSRASKKSVTTSINLVKRMMQYPQANTLVVRKTAATLKDSCWSQLKWAINKLGVSQFWKARQNPLEIEYLPTGQKFLFRGLDDPLKVTSITVDVGVLCWGWLEEAYEIECEEDFNKVDESLRGQMPPGYFIQWSITFNPWDRNHWLKHRFFDPVGDPNILAKTTNYLCNEFLSLADLKLFEDMKKNDPERYKVAGLGEWGIAEGQFFEMWRSDKHIVKPFKIPEGWVRFRAMDWGSYHPYCVHWYAVDYDGNIWCYRELYGWGGKPNVGTKETAEQVAEKIAEADGSDKIDYAVLDNACWNSTGTSAPCIAEAINNVLWEHRHTTFIECEKGRQQGAEQLRMRLVGRENGQGDNEPAIYFFSTCIHTIRTIPMLTHDKHNPEKYDTQGEDHCFIAGTMITTARGNVPIEQVTTDDYVLTRKGYMPVEAANMTRRNTDVMTMVASNGKTLTGTGNHPVYVNGKGFTQLDSIKYGDIMLCKQENNGSDIICLENKHQQQTALYLTGLLLDDIQTQKTNQIACITGQTEGCASKEYHTYTMRFGSSIMEKYRKVITFTTKMVIQQTMIFRTLRQFLPKNICQGIHLNALAKILDGSRTLLKKQEIKQSYGISRQTAESGTGSMLLKQQPNEKTFQRSQKPANNAEKVTKSDLTAQGIANIVQKHVTQSIAGIAESTTKQDIAQYAATSSSSTSTAKSKHAAKNVVRALCLTTAGKADVYNLTVKGEHEYFANGFLVHNCADTAVYACLSRPWTPEPPIKDQYKHDAYEIEEKPSAWSF